MEGEGRGRCRSMKAAEVNVACMAVARGQSRARAMAALLPRIRARSPASRCIANAQIMIALKWTRSTPLNTQLEEGGRIPRPPFTARAQRSKLPTHFRAPWDGMMCLGGA